MKKILKNGISFVFMALLLCVAVFAAPEAEAASYPLLVPEEHNLTATAGEMVELKYSYYPAFKNEELSFEIYDENGYVVATATDSFYHTNNLINYTLEWDTDGYSAGKYTVVVTKKFYSAYEWHEAPSKTEHYVELIGGECDHTYKTTTKKATLSKNGKQVSKCTECGEVKSSKTIYYPKSIKLSTSTYTYNGKVKTPTVVVKDSKGNTLKKDTDYTVKYAKGRKNPGKYTVTVTFKGKYEGTKKLTLTIKPNTPSITDIYSKTKGKATVKWSNVAGESGFQLYYATSKDGSYKKVNSYEANKLAGSKTKLKSGKKYYFKVRAYKKTSNGTVYSSWSAVKSVKVK